MTERPPLPDFMIEYYKIPDLPQCCHTCDYYSESGHCVKFDMRPPNDFANSQNQCPEWEAEIPF